MAVSAVIASLFGVFVIRSAEVGQVVWPLLIGFTTSTIIAHQFFPRSHPLALLLTPAITGAIWHAYAAITWSGGGSELLLLAYFENRIAGPALGLPIHFASAGITGAAIGLGWSHALIRNHLILSGHAELHPHDPTHQEDEPAQTA